MTHKNSIWSIWNFLYPQYTIMILRVLFMCIYWVSTMSRRWKKGQAYDYDKENPNFRKKRNCQIHCKYCLKRSCIIHLIVICFLTHLWFWKKINSWWKTFWGPPFFPQERNKDFNEKWWRKLYIITTERKKVKYTKEIKAWHYRSFLQKWNWSPSYSTE